MEISQLEAFERAAREGSFTRAADSLGLTQPAVSMRINTLEAELNGKLFERHGRQLQLTPLGERFLPYAQRILGMMADGLQDVKHFQQGKTGQIKIAAPAPFVMSFMVDVLEAFRFQHPQVDILIRERNKTTVLDMLADNMITLGLVNAPVFDQRMTQIARWQDPILPVVASTHPLVNIAQKNGDLVMDDIYRYTIFRVSMFPQMSAFMDDVVENARAGSGGAVIAIPMVMSLRLILTGQGVTFLPHSIIKPHLAAGSLTTLDIADMPQLMSEPVLIALKERKLDPIHIEFVRIMKAQLRHMDIKTIKIAPE